MKQTKVIALVGMPGSGKSTCVDHLVEKNFPKVYFGGVIVDETARRFGEVNEKNERQVREELRAQEGLGAVAARVLPKIDELLQAHETVIADGLYGWTEYKILQEHYGDSIVVIAIVAPRKDRYSRLVHRPIRPLTEEEVKSRDYAEIENSEKGGPIAYADYTIVNDGPVEDLLARLDGIIGELK
ncbi:MAG TPA: AAA family ATPase [Bacillota bacterium]|nr:AAA family ATPase [Bacillota bacterium]